MKKKNCYDLNDVNAAEIPEFVYESLARSLLPVIQKYYESDEGKRAFAEWKRKRSCGERFYINEPGGLPCFGSPPGFAFTNLQFPRYKQ